MRTFRGSGLRNHYPPWVRRTTKAILRIKLAIRRADPQSVYVQGFNAAKVLDKSRSTPFFIDVDWEALAKPT
jgi:hypothetical protein